MSKALDNIIRHNWGYEDGKSDRARGKAGPVWAKCYLYRPRHPFDKHYGEGYWKGYYGEAPGNKYAIPA